MLDRLLDRLLGLPPAEGPAPSVTKGIPVPMSDGVRLLADRYAVPGDEPRPVVLIRTPYGRKGLMGRIFGATFARHGLQTVLQSTRGTFGSGGEFRPFHLEKEDGLATVAWLREQPWCDGRIAMAGASYLGHTQWAVAPYLDEPLEALCLAITASEFVSTFYPGGILAVDNMVSWSALIGRQEGRFAGVPNPWQTKKTRAAMAHLPISGADVAAIGKQVKFLQDVSEHAEPGDDFWAPSDHSGRVAALTTPVTMVTGWYDLFISAQLRDFKELAAAGREPRITIGPWAHGEPASLRTLVSDQIGFLAAHLLGDTAQLRQAPVRLYLQGAGRWLDFEDWPPKSDATPYFLRPGGLSVAEPVESKPGTFTYDPADPTPTVGGPLLSGVQKQRDNKIVEERPDVLLFTGDKLKHDLDVIGEISALVHVRTDIGHGDVYVRLCDVDGRGVSRNVTDGILRLRPGDFAESDVDGVVAAEVHLDPTAYRFRRGHRLRLQVAGGAFPRFARNHGTDEPVFRAVDGKPARFEIFHDPARPSRITLPVFSG